jgi:REP-associated tyrosine transposase
VRRTTQKELQFPEQPKWGGRRKNAGRRKRKGSVAHAPRESVSKHDPRLVTLKLVEGLPRLRTSRAGDAITNCIRAAQRSNFRIVHYSIQSDHLHLIVESDDRAALSGGMKGFTCRVARGLNKLWRRRGRVFVRRFHDRVLRSLRQVRNALRYVLNNHLKHMEHASSGGTSSDPDWFSSGRFFDGWKGRAPDRVASAEGAVVAPAGWKIRKGWKRYYAAIALDEVPVL